jgi:hypothetical protein
MPLTTLAFLWAPMLGAIAGAIATIPFVPPPQGNAAYFILFAVVGAGVAIAITLALGLPTVLFLEHKKALTLRTVLAVSVIASTLAIAATQVALIAVNQSWPAQPLWPPASFLVFGYTCAIVTAAILWRVRKSKNAA